MIVSRTASRSGVQLGAPLEKIGDETGFLLDHRSLKIRLFKNGAGRPRNVSMLSVYNTRPPSISHQSLPDPDARRALTALLVRIARADGDYAEIEAARIDRIAWRATASSPFEAAALRREAETLEAEAPDTVRFTRAIKDAVPYEERAARDRGAVGRGPGRRRPRP